MRQALFDTGLSVNELPAAFDWSLTSDFNLHSGDAMDADEDLEELWLAPKDEGLGEESAEAEEWLSIPGLVQIYLDWTHARTTVPPTLFPSACQSSTDPGSDTDTPPWVQWPIPVISLDVGKPQEVMIVQGVNEDANATLMRPGFIAGTPVQPTLAFSVDALRLASHLWCNLPGIGIQGLVKSFCAFLHVPYKHGIEALFSNTFDIFLEITRRVDKMADKALGWDQPDCYGLAPHRTLSAPHPNHGTHPNIGQNATDASSNAHSDRRASLQQARAR
ncbi:hypothetical protein K488DRAFT_91936 [Vararia minispora EC-137]|uniref:Uncharacterized protein n=1 Tax=Vararia minispora EC-137 TaxID=1314806 RepID=A0ACB8Q576_9AGAM|nr:hypothetical protein K488DRAFT_91936 [Vararia minispora EC-137]